MRHEYLSTACLHGAHGHCKAKTNFEGEPKIPGTCKWCAAPCVCDCHEEPVEERDGLVSAS